ncbi:hypothetical protein BDZ88DRAFT_454738 [Geranomyces variabilis]|nr:hypothetical protein BDZ88DRAFT_454738 [Geranomyces variabilis]KAJ3136066.1 hypothetical protein HDU90_003469 [Geranomyces variabilis]
MVRDIVAPRRKWKRIPANARAGPMPTVSATHAYIDADVRIVVGDTVFLVHTVFLKHRSEYFETCFRGPWDENSTLSTTGDKGLRQVNLDDLDPEHFSRLLDWIYKTETFFAPALEPAEAFQLGWVADRFQVGSLLAFLDQLSPPPLTWDNIEEWLGVATGGPRRFERLIECCSSFLQKANTDSCIRALYLAETHDLQQRLSPHDIVNRWNVNLLASQCFDRLSLSLQRDLLVAFMKNRGL